MKPLYIYLEEITIRFSYLIFCFAVNSIYIFYNIEIFIFSECYTSLLNESFFDHFLVTEPLHIINILYRITLYYSLLFLYPLFLLHFVAFFSNSLYKYQKDYLLKLLKFYIIVFFPINLLIHVYLVKNLIIFLFN